MTRKQWAVLLGLNALISTVIAVVVVVVAMSLLRDRTVPSTGGSTPAAVGGVEQTEALPSPTPIVHVVQAGESISYLAAKYDVPAEDIIAANHLPNANYLSVGQELIIPVGGVAQVSPTLTPPPTPTTTPIPFEPPSAQMTASAAASAAAPTSCVPELGQVVIDSVMGAGRVEEERVVVLNSSPCRVDLQGWTLGAAGEARHTYPALVVYPGVRVTVHTGVGNDNPPLDFYLGKLQAMWAVGEVATLKDVSGRVVATYTIRE